MNERFSMTEPFPASETVKERIPTVDSFGDIDEALAWVADRLNSTIIDDKDMSTWWNSPHEALGKRSPGAVWSEDPDFILRWVGALSH
jgi:hypothetical protein